ncbi:MAG TPA: D-glycero-beta-D-manno-heptose-7-phosphate kinase [Candidatus Baltobacteraceae bacterium]|jgi:D-beta-D-heptose 7-phosphate kinase/D-beta-D-heptose 1-phosphate adenosyltransferase|nr:D-glycero-beta-D-manno-heptose-7-phosphate kinase [Candidatus Baltobacteraceae bacterium]
MSLQILAPPDARSLFERMRERSVLVVGDVMVDEWIWGTVTRISPEAPVPVVAVNDHSFTLGGAGNVANNLRALGARVRFAAAIGNDGFAHYVSDILTEKGIDTSGLVSIEDRPTTRKTRVVAHNQQVVRADWESTAPLSAHDRSRLASVVGAAAKDVDAVVLSDYAKGLFSRDIVQAALCAPIVVADPKPQNLALFSGVTCVAPNASEAAQATGIPIAGDASLEAAGARLLDMLNCRYVVITRGEHGMSLFGRSGERLNIGSVARTVFDVSGAGDTVAAVLSLALAAGASIELAMQLANFAAGAVVEKLGTATASPDEILALVEHGHA